LAVARAAAAQARAARDIAQINVDRTRITAPVAGRVSSRNAQIGAIATASAGPMFTLIADGSIEFEGEVIETALPALRPGQLAELDVAGVGRITGQVRQLPAAVDATTRLGLVRVELPADERLLIGLFVSGDIVTERRGAVTVPATAVLADASGERVQVVEGGVVETRAVRAGLLWQGQREITEGLAAGETVIARAGAFFRSGDRVSATTEPQDTPPPDGAMADNPGEAPPAAASGTPGGQASAASEAAAPLAAQAAETGARP
ncbi:MAG TPA: efflux RND transporter periplasmic adaptor subunit, partial [Paracoccus solventivorans]